MMNLEDVLSEFTAPIAARLRRLEVVAARVAAETQGRVAFVGVHPLVDGRFKVARFEVSEALLEFDLTPELLEDEQQVEVGAEQLLAALEKLGVGPEQLKSPMRAGYPV